MMFRRAKWAGAAALTGALVMAAPAIAAPGWTAVTIPSTGNNVSLLGASARTNTDAWAAGTGASGGLIEHWNGTTWSIVPSPTPGAYPELSGVAGRSASDVYAVGTNLLSVNGGPEQALILRWNGTAWSADSNGVFGGALAAAATFPGAASEWAVGRGSGNQGLVLSHS
jgi:hypothetical protein